MELGIPQRRGRNLDVVRSQIRRTVRLNSERRRAIRGAYIVVAVILAVMSLPFVLLISQGVAEEYQILLSISIYLVPLLVWLHRKFRGLSEISIDLRNANLSLEVILSSASQDEAKALKFFRINQDELSRYYRVNIVQTRAIFRVGIGAIFVGLLFAGGVIWAITQPSQAEANRDWTTEGAAAALGVAATIMTGFVGSVLLKMYKESANTLEVFHSSLSQTNAILFANVLAANLSQKEKISAVRGMIEALARYRSTIKAEEDDAEAGAE